MARKTKQPPTSRAFQVDVDGVTYHGHYSVERGMITVRNADWTWQETTQLGGHAGYPEALARLMLSQALRRRT